MFVRQAAVLKKKSALGDVRSVIPLSLDRQGCVAIVQHADIIIIIKKKIKSKQ